MLLVTDLANVKCTFLKSTLIVEPPLPPTRSQKAQKVSLDRVKSLIVYQCTFAEWNSHYIVEKSRYF